jgi:hypothetical protein
METRRVIITDETADGKSRVLEDRNVGMFGPGVFNFWQTLPNRRADDMSIQNAEASFFPPPGGTQFRLFMIPPMDPSMTPAQVREAADGFFDHIGWKETRRDTSRHPFMHVTPTVDYIVLLEGEISLVVDEGDPIPLRQYDAVVQRRTNHSWLNTGKTAALLMCVMVGTG